MDETSILGTIKDMLGIPEDDSSFDQELIVYINSSFTVLYQLGAGPKTGFAISDEYAQWSDFISDSSLYETVKMYVYLSVKSLFDPPASSYVLDAYKEQIKELCWRITVQVDEDEDDDDE